MDYRENRVTGIYITRLMNKELPLQKRDPKALTNVPHLETLLRGLQKLAALASADPQVNKPETAEATVAVNETLQHFQACPAWEPRSVTGEPGWKVTWYKQGLSQPFMEVTAAMNILRIAEHGQLWRFGECEFCTRWMFKRVKRQRFCATRPCKEKFERTDPEFRKARAAVAKIDRAEKIRLQRRTNARDGIAPPRRGRPRGSKNTRPATRTR